MFCPNCGTKALDNAEFCQQCGAKLLAGAEEKKQTETSAWQTQVQSGQYPIGAPEKKGKKWPIILGIAAGIICLLVILVVIVGGSISSKKQSQEDSKEENLSEKNLSEMDLSETYTNEEEGISFQYPSGWKLVREDKFADYIKEEEYDLVLLVNENDDQPEENSMIWISKFEAMPQEIDAFFTDDENFASIFELENDAIAKDTSMTKIDGVAARTITYTYVDEDSMGYQSYFYAVGSTLYRISFCYAGESAGNRQKLFDAIIDSYKITAAATAETESDVAQENRILFGETQIIENEYLGSFEVTLDYIEFADQWEDLYTVVYPEQDNIFLCAGVTLKNIGKKDGGIISLWNTLLYDGTYEFSQRYKGGKDADIPPLSSPETVVYVFQVPISAVESDKSLVLNIGGSGSSAGLFFVLREGEDGSVSIPGNEETLGGDYTDYLLWCGEYDNGWMDTSLTFELYSDGTQDPECGYVTINFRGNEARGKLYYLGGNKFRLEPEEISSTQYYIYTIENEAGYQLDFYNLDGGYEVTFTQYQQYIS